MTKLFWTVMHLRAVLNKPALVTLVNILSTVAADAWIRIDRTTATRTLQSLRRRLQVNKKLTQVNATTVKSRLRFPFRRRPKCFHYKVIHFQDREKKKTTTTKLRECWSNIDVHESSRRRRPLTAI